MPGEAPLALGPAVGRALGPLLSWPALPFLGGALQFLFYEILTLMLRLCCLDSLTLLSGHPGPTGNIGCARCGWEGVSVPNIIPERQMVWSRILDNTQAMILYHWPLVNWGKKTCSIFSVFVFRSGKKLISRWHYRAQQKISILERKDRFYSKSPKKACSNSQTMEQCRLAFANWQHATAG